MGNLADSITLRKHYKITVYHEKSFSSFAKFPLVAYAFKMKCKMKYE